MNPVTIFLHFTTILIIRYEFGAHPVFNKKMWNTYCKIKNSPYLCIAIERDSDQKQTMVW